MNQPGVDEEKREGHGKETERGRGMARRLKEGGTHIQYSTLFTSLESCGEGKASFFSPLMMTSSKGATMVLEPHIKG